VVIPAKLRSAELDPQIAVSRENVSSLLEAGACAANAMTVRILEADHKVVILGGGPAGLSAAIYAARAAMQPLVVSKDSGQLETTSVIDNYPGYEDGAFVGMIASLGDWPPAVAARTARLGLSLSDWLAGWRASPPHTSPCPHRRARRGRDAAAPAQAGSPLRRRLQEL
jgi:glycine/D-amino acid oxidase-like deaminating enzyme